MSDPTHAAIPDRRAFKATEVCEIAKIQPYVLRSWESEFPDLGVARAPGGARIYRRQDVERVLLIKQLVFGEGLTISGARRRIDEREGGAASEAPEVLRAGWALDDDTRVLLVRVRETLRELSQLLSRTPSAGAAGESVDGRRSTFALEADRNSSEAAKDATPVTRRGRRTPRA